MSRISQSLFLPLFIFAVSSSVQAQPSTAASNAVMKEFSSGAGRFKVVLPGTPTETTQVIEADVGKIERHTFMLDAGFGAYLVSYSDFPIALTEPGGIDRFLNQAHEGEIAFLDGKLSGMTEISLDGYPGREFRVETPDSIFRMKYYLVGTRFYQIAITTWSEGLLAEDLKEIMASLKKEGQTAPAAVVKERDPAKNAAAVAASLDLIATEFLASFKLTVKPAADPRGPAADRRFKVIAPDGKGVVIAPGRLKPGRALKRLQPSYPSKAKAARVSGSVEVQVTISEEGQVIQAIAVSGPELLREAAEQAARQWVFEPATLDGQPVKVQGLLTFNFGLN